MSKRPNNNNRFYKIHDLPVTICRLKRVLIHRPVDQFMQNMFQVDEARYTHVNISLEYMLFYIYINKTKRSIIQTCCGNTYITPIHSQTHMLWEYLHKPIPLTNTHAVGKITSTPVHSQAHMQNYCTHRKVFRK